MRDIISLIFLVALLASCETTAPVSPNKRTVSPNKRIVNVRTTFYDNHEDRYGSRIAMTNAYRASEGRTMAAPSSIPFNTHVTLPLLNGVVGNGRFNVEDRGSYLERAYRKGQLRLDVFVSNRRKLRWCKYHLPEYMEASIE